MNFTEVLKAQGLTDEQIVKISADMKSNKIYLASEENMDVRYNKLKLESEQNAQELAKSQALIDELQKGNKGNEELQGKIKDYETQIANLKKANEEQKLESALDRVLLEANVQDVDYVKFKIKEKGTELKLDDKGNLTGTKELLDDLKVQLPTQFSNVKPSIKEIKIPHSDGDKSVTKDDFKKMNYHERLKLYNDNREAYEELTKQN